MAREREYTRYKHEQRRSRAGAILQSLYENRDELTAIPIAGSFFEREPVCN